MDKIIFLGSIIIIFDFIGLYLAYLYGRKTKIFRWSEYFAIILFPIIGVLAFAYLIDSKILALFLVSACFGFVLEYILGFVYHKTLNKKLWEYKRLSVGGYTSLLSIPMWGIGGCLFWFLSKMVGL